MCTVGRTLRVVMLVDVEVGMYQIGHAFAVLRQSNGRVNRQVKLAHALALRSRANGRGENDG